MYEPGNARFKEQLAQVEKQLEATRSKSDAFKIK
jgi:hypothetical protein